MRDTNLDMMSDPSLWFRIRGAMLPVDRAGRSFARQLSEVTGLAVEAAKALEDEYRRFLYLAALTPSPREPLGLLRKAWEYHAGFEGYLYDFCPWVLDRHLPAGPVTKLSAPAYAATWFDYGVEFGAPPPESYWPAPETRMAMAEVQGLAASGVPQMQSQPSG